MLKQTSNSFLRYGQKRYYFNTAYGMVSNKKMIRVGTQVASPYVIKSTDNGTVRYTGFCIDILNVIADKLNFSYSLEQPADGEWGELRDGQWTGLMGMLERQEIEMASTILTLTTERIKIADWTMPVAQDFVVVTVRKVEHQLGWWAVFLSPFTWQVYLCTLLMLLCCPCFLYIIYKVQHLMLRLPDRMSLTDVAEFLFGSLLQKAMPQTQTGGTRRVFVACWCLCSLFLSSCYTCLLTSQMMKVTSEPPFTTLEEMLTLKDMRWGMLGGTSVTMALRNSKHGILQEIYKGMIHFSKTDPDVFSIRQEVHLRKILEGNYAFIEISQIMKHWAATQCDIAVLDSARVLGLRSYAFYTVKNWTLTKDIQQVLLELQETGVETYLRSKWFPPVPNCQDKQPAAITLATLQGPFYVSVAGLVVALAVLILECCVRKWRQRKIRRGNSEHT